jgi:hypothetical protein
VTAVRQDKGEHIKLLPALPNRWGGDGYDWMEELSGGWRPVASWGSQGWDLGSWPYVIVAICRIRTEDQGTVWGVCTYVEGDLTVESFTRYEDLIAAVDKIAEFYWRHAERGPNDLPEEGGLLPHHQGPYTG